MKGSLFQSTGSSPSYHSLAKELGSSFVFDLLISSNTEDWYFSLYGLA